MAFRNQNNNSRRSSGPQGSSNKPGESFWNDLGGGSVFISHSHKDLSKVRLIRNSLEKRGFDPLCFYMQCLTDEDEIEGLLKREIDAREWFAFMESQNSMQSAWVRKERDYIRNRSDKKILYYKLADGSPDEIAEHIMDHMTVYVCYSERDKEYGSPVAQFLRKMDFRVYDRCDAEENGDDVFSERYLEQTRNAIRDAAQHGCFLFLMTLFSRQALMMRRELEFAILEGACVAVAFLGISPMDIPTELQYLIRNAACTSIDGDLQSGMTEIASLVGRVLLQKADGKE